MSEKIQPKVRFSGFTDAWEQRKLGDIVVFLNGRAYKQAELLDSGKYPVLRVGNFNTNDKWYYSDLELPAKNYADKGDLLYTWATAFGPHIWKGPKVIYHYHIWKVETTSDISKNFAVHLLDADQAQMTNSLNGSTMVHITKGTMENKIVTIPGISEQRNMARLLDQLDCTIALHQSKLEELKTVKKLAMQKIFDQEWRFKGFTDPWEDRKLGDLATSFEYGLNASAKEFDGIHKYIRITDIDDSSRKFDHESLTSPDIDLSSADNYKLQYGDILFARTGASVGKTYIYSDSDGLVYYAGFLIRARIKSGVDSNFIFQHTLTSSYENFIRVTSQRSGQPGVNAKEYSIFEISVPSYEEQQRIGSFFKQLDNTIALHQQKCDQLKKVKKWCMQNLFV